MLRRLAVCLGVGKGSGVTILGKCWVQPREQGGTFRGGVWQEFMWEGRGLLSCKRKWEGVGMVSGPVGVGREVSRARVERLGLIFVVFFFFQLKYIADIQCCVNFCCTTKWFGYIHTHRHTHIHIYMCICIYTYMYIHLRGGAVVKNLFTNAGDARDSGFNSWVRKIPWSRKRQPTPVFLENAIDREDWWATVHGVSKSHTRARTHTRIHTHTHAHSVLKYYFPLWFIIGYRIQLSVLHSRTLLFTHSIYKSLQLLTPISHSCSHPTPSSLTTNSLFTMSMILSLFHRLNCLCHILDSIYK